MSAALVRVGGFERDEAGRDDGWPSFSRQVWPVLWQAVWGGSAVFAAAAAVEQWGSWVGRGEVRHEGQAPVVELRGLAEGDLHPLTLCGCPLGVYYALDGRWPASAPLRELYPVWRWRDWSLPSLARAYGDDKVAALAYLVAQADAPTWYCVGFDADSAMFVRARA